MNYTKLIYKFVQGALGLCLFAVVAILLLGHFGYINTVKPFVVQSGSMEPTVPTASVIFSLPQDSYQQGDIITFHPEGNSKKTVTHRIEFKLYPDGVNGEPLFLTAGDANEDVDNWEVRNDYIIGKAVFSVPYVGYLVDFAKRPEGFILLVIIPATIVIYEELKNLFNEIKKGFKKLLKSHTLQGLPLKGRRTISDNKHSDNNSSPPKTWAIVPIVGAGVFMIAFSASYFTDLEDSIGNIFRAGVWGGPTPSITPVPSPSITPPPQGQGTLVINEVLPDSSCSQGNIEAQWIELYNGYDYAINPKNFKITDGVNTIDLVTANNLSIAPGGLLLLAHNSAIWNDCYSDNGVQTGNLGGQLDIDTGMLQLIDTDGTAVIDTVIWGDEALNPAQDESIEREPKGMDTALGDEFNESDFVVRPTPQPGI